MDSNADAFVIRKFLACCFALPGQFPKKLVSRIFFLETKKSTNKQTNKKKHQTSPVVKASLFDKIGTSIKKTVVSWNPPRPMGDCLGDYLYGCVVIVLDCWMLEFGGLNLEIHLLPSQLPFCKGVVGGLGKTNL